MKKITLVLVAILFAVTGIFAQTPNEFNPNNSQIIWKNGCKLLIQWRLKQQIKQKPTPKNEQQRYTILQEKQGVFYQF